MFIINQYFIEDNLRLMMEGRINAISTSKIRKMMAIKKNWRENGIRDEDFWSKPHSKGESFSRSNEDLKEMNVHTVIIMFAMTRTIIAESIMFIINY